MYWVIVTVFCLDMHSKVLTTGRYTYLYLPLIITRVSHLCDTKFPKKSWSLIDKHFAFHKAEYWAILRISTSEVPHAYTKTEDRFTSKFLWE